MGGGLCRGDGARGRNAVWSWFTVLCWTITPERKRSNVKTKTIMINQLDVLENEFKFDLLMPEDNTT
jgi:hypothetical protein